MAVDKLGNRGTVSRSRWTTAAVVAVGQGDDAGGSRAALYLLFSPVACMRQHDIAGGPIPQQSEPALLQTSTPMEGKPDTAGCRREGRVHECARNGLTLPPHATHGRDDPLSERKCVAVWPLRVPEGGHDG